MAATILKLTETIAVVKIMGTGGTINPVDLLSPTQISQGTYKIGINFIQWAVGTSVSIVRNGVTVADLYTNSGSMDFSGYGGCTDYTESASPLVVTIVGGGTVLLTLRKSSGYKSKIETETYGPYDNTAAVGS